MKKLLTALYAFACCCLLSLSMINAADAQTTTEITKGNCKVCAEECQKTLDYCNKKGGNYGAANISNALKDCITACKMTEDYIARNSSYGTKTAAICIEACNNCAKSCESFKNDDKMRATADECRKCAGNCSKLK